MTELETYLKRHEGRTLANTPDSDMLLLDIARSLRALVSLSEEGLKFSHSLASLMTDDSGKGN